MARTDKEIKKTQTSDEQQVTPVGVISVKGEPIDTNTSTPTEDANASNVAQTPAPTSTSGASGSADYNAHLYYNEGNTTPTAGTTANGVTIETAKEIRPTSTTTGTGEEGAGTGGGQMNEPEPTETGTPETGTPETPETPGGTGAGGGYTAPMPVRGSRYTDMVGPYNAPYTQKELDKAKKKGRRESRMATAGHIMDTLARVMNYAATTQGAPSAKWSNQNREVDPNTYYSRLRGENDKARNDYMNMIFKAGAADNDEYATALKGWNAGREDARKEAEAQRQKDLHPGNLEAQEIANEGAELKNEGQRIANENAPEENRLKNDVLKAQAANSRASANAHNARAAAYGNGGKGGSKKNGDKMILPMMDEKGNVVKDNNGQIRYMKYDDEAAYWQARSALSKMYNIDDRQYKTKGMLGTKEYTSSNLSNRDYTTVIATAIANRDNQPAPTNNNIFNTPWNSNNGVAFGNK